MKAYHVQRVGAMWQVSVTDGAGIVEAEDRDVLVSLARELAMGKSRQVFVYSSDNQNLKRFIRASTGPR